MIKKIIIHLFMVNILLFISCSTQLIRESKTLSGIRNAGLIIRISNGSKITKDEFIRNALYWLSNYEKSENIFVIKDASDAVDYYKYAQERFYQLSNENDYLKYKSIGVVNLYLQNNRNELSAIMSKHKLDGLIIYEVYNIISTEMQFLDFDSVIAVVDSGLNIAYLDHFNDHYDSESSMLDELKNQMMDKINTNLIQDLQSLDLLGGMMEAGYKVSTHQPESIKPEEKPVPQIESSENTKMQENDTGAEGTDNNN